MIDPTYYQTWFNVVDETRQRYSWPIPVYITQYMSAVLANYVDKPDWQPEPSWAETLMTLSSALDAKELGDQALIAAGIFPTMFYKKGIKEDYFHSIGRSSYSQAQKINQELFGVMSRNFVFISHCVMQTVSDNPQITWKNN